MKRLILIGTVFVLSACSSSKPPVAAMVYASAALKAAKRVRAEKKAADHYRKAESEYWQAKSSFAANSFEEARKSAFNARRQAERAEYRTERRKVSGLTEELDL